VAEPAAAPGERVLDDLAAGRIRRPALDAFWGVPAAEAQVQQIMFMKNLAIFGALIFVAANGAGPASIDARQARLAAA